MAVQVQSYAVADVAALSANVTINKPSGTVSGNLLVCITSTLSSTPTAVSITGFTTVKGTGNNYFSYRQADGTEGSTFTVNRSGSNSSVMTCIIFRITGHSAALIDVYDGVAAQAQTTHALPSVTATTGGLLLSALFVSGNITPTSTAPSGMATAVDDATPANSAIAYSTQSIVSGATGTKTWTSTSANNGTAGHIVIPAAAVTADISLAGTDSVTSAITLGRPGDVSLAGTDSITTGVALTRPADVSLSGTGSITAGVSAGRAAAISLSGTGSLASDAVRGTFGDAALLGTGSITPAGVRATSVDASSVAGTGSVDAAGSRGQTLDDTVAGTGSVTASVGLQITAGASLAGTGSISVAVGRTLHADASLSGAGAVDDAATHGVSADASLAGTGSLTTAGSTGAASASVVGTGTIAAGAALSTGVQASITGTGSIGGTETRGAVAQGSVTGSAGITPSGSRDSALDSTLTGAGGITPAARHGLMLDVDVEASVVVTVAGVRCFSVSLPDLEGAVQVDASMRLDLAAAASLVGDWSDPASGVTNQLIDVDLTGSGSIVAKLVIKVTTPPERTVVTDAEFRVEVISSEDRVVVTSADARTA